MLKGILIILGIVFVLFIVLFFYGCMILSSRESRLEEKRELERLKAEAKERELSNDKSLMKVIQFRY